MNTSSKSLIIVNATNLEGGGFNALLQFLDSVKQYGSSFNWIVFVPNNDYFQDYNIDNVKFIGKPDVKKSWLKRVVWDLYGLRSYTKGYHLKPLVIISLQNTGVRFPNVKQIVYIHQSLVLEREFRWNPFNVEERNLFLRKHLIFLMMKLTINKNTYVIVQGDWIRDKIKKLFHIPDEKIFKILPQVLNLNNVKNLLRKNNNQSHNDFFTFFYPSGPPIYKNIEVILNSVKLLKQKSVSKFIVIITINGSENAYTKRLVKMAENKGLSSYFKFIGKIPYEEVLKMYNSSDALLFPSYIETFGLPLIEAAAFGLPILVADRPYSHEVIGDYEGATFLDYKNPKIWADAIAKLIKTKPLFTPYHKSDTEINWNSLFDEDKVNRYIFSKLNLP